MITRRSTLAGLALPALTPALAFGQDRRSADRALILAMTGDYRVRFDFRETTAFVADYKPIAPAQSGGFEVIRIIEDSPRLISLQHILVGQMGGETIVTKHWRQDWTFEPREVLTYQALDRWTVTPVSARDREGAWSQTVWQTDDSPRYGGVGRWVTQAGVARWDSNMTRRPLARRDAVRKPPYNAYVGTNRHALTPAGWVHEQENAKVGPRGGGDQVIVHEVVTNTYERFNGFPVKAATDYWAATHDYWAAVRTAWDAAIRKGRGVAVKEEADMGSVTSLDLMGFADEIAEGRLTTTAAVAKARETIAKLA